MLTDKNRVSKGILLVDDNAIFRISLKQSLEKQGFNVIGDLNDGSEVLPFLKNHYPSIIIMDIDMKGMNGIETTELITKAYPVIKIIGLSSYDAKEYQQKMKVAGAVGFISKWYAGTSKITEIILSHSF